MREGEDVRAWDESSNTTGRYRVVATSEHPFSTQERGWGLGGRDNLTIARNSLCGSRTGRRPVENAYSHYEKHGLNFSMSGNLSKMLTASCAIPEYGGHGD